MKKLYVAVVLFFIAQFPLNAQCLQIESILVDACVPGSGCTNSVSPTCNCEGKNEMVVFRVGASPLTISSIVATWPNNSFIGWHTPDATTASNVSTLNSTIVKCGFLKEPTGGILPANSEVMIITSTDMCLTANSFANLQDTMIVMFQNPGNFQGHFANTNNSGTITSVPTGTTSLRSLSLSYAPLTCTQTVTYDRKLLVNQMGTYGGSAAQNDGSTVQFDALGNATYVNFGCQAPYIPIQVKPSASTNVCYNGTLNLTGAVSGPYTTFSWSGGTGTFGNPNSLNTTYTPGSGDIGTVTIYLTAQGKCASNIVKDSIVVSITPAPSPTITATPAAAVCPGANVVLSVNPEASTTYSWMPAGLSGSTVTVTPSSQTIYTVIATNSCTSTNSNYTVNVLPSPTVTVVNDSICPGGTGTLTASGANSYTWNTSATGSSLTDNPASTTQYTVTGTDGNGCMANGTGQIFIYALPVVNVVNDSVCPGATGTLVASGANTYTWNTSVTGSSLSDAPSSATQYTVTGTDQHGCANSGTGEIFIYTPATISVSSPSVCPGATATITASGAATYTWNTAQTGSSISVAPASTTTYTATGTDVNGCTNTGTGTVFIYTPATISVSSATICPGSSAVLTASGGSTYTWSTGGTAASETVTPSSNSSYTVTGTDINGCATNAAVATVAIVNSLTVSATAASASVCPGNATSLTASGAANYSWSPASSLSSTSGGTVTATPTVNTTYTVIGTSGTCADTNVVTVNVYSLPTITATSGTVCAGDTTTLTAGGAQTYTWSPASGLSSATGSSVNAYPLGNTTYTITGTDNNGCQNSVTASVLVNQLPAITVNSPSVCAGSPATLTVTGASTYTWSTAQTGTVITVSPSSNTSYTVSGTDANGCSNAAISNVSIWNLPNVTATNTMVCKGQSVVVTASGAVNYVWSNSQNGSSITVNPPTTTTYTVLGTDANGCMNFALATVTVNLPPNISSSNASFCASGTATLTANGAVTYTWSTSQTGASIVVSPTSSTNYTVTGTDSNGCTNTSISNVTVNSLPTINVNNPGVCPGSSVVLNASGASTYTWSTAQTGGTISVNPTTATNYTVTGTDANGCTNSAVATVTINPSPIITASSATTCAGVNTSLTAAGAATYTWNSGQTGATINVAGVAATYTVTGTDVNGCIGSAVTSVSVTAPPTAQTISGSAVICPGQNTVLSVPSGPYAYSWTGPNGSLGSSDSAVANSAGVYNVVVSNACGNASAQYTVTVSSPQAVFAPNVITAQAPATFTFTNASSGAQLSSYWNFANGSNSTQWSPAATYTTDGAYDVTLIVTDQYGCMDTTDFIVYVTDTLPPVIIPNIFSPNGDLINDLFMIKGHGLSYFECHIFDRWGLELYHWQDINDGWDGKNHANGQIVSDGTYYYLVSYIDKKGKYSSVGGYLQLVR